MSNLPPDTDEVYYNGVGGGGGVTKRNRECMTFSPFDLSYIEGLFASCMVSFIYYGLLLFISVIKS